MSLRAYHVMGVLAVACLLVGSGAFSAASVERGVTVSVAPDEQALLGIDAPDSVTVSGGEQVTGNDTEVPGEGKGNENGANDGQSGLRRANATLLDVSNRFTQPVDVTVSVMAVTDGFPRVEGFERTYSLTPGDEPVSVATNVTCPGNGQQERDVTVTLDADGESVGAEMNRTVTVTCG
jgi:hypothetical protein